MTDRELLEAAAKAAGVKYNFICPDGAHCGDINTMQDRFWNPLEDDGDALRLAVKLGAQEYIGSYIDRYCTRDEYQADPYAATRRAIVRAAAAIGKEKA